MKRYAISDIHGNANAFLKLLDYVDPDPEELVILGDLCNRGLQTWEVFDECDLLLDEGATIVMGNHDAWLKDYLNNRLAASTFMSENIGGLTTIKSIELAIQKGEPVRETMNRVLDRMVMYHEEDDYIFVHAGIDPRIHYMEDQNREVLLMGCGEWRNPKMIHTFDQTVVFGHTPTFNIHRGITEEETKIWSSKQAKKMAIDTGAGFGCRLTLADLYEGIAYAYDFTTHKIVEYRFKRKERY